MFYTWSEEQAGKGSVGISSDLFTHLTETDFQGCSVLRLFSDGCVSQNKNNIVLRTLVHFLETHTTTIQKILLFFPVRGHSFLPADRVFGRAEKLLRKRPIISTKEEYHDIYSEIGKIKVLGKDWELLDTKELSRYYKDIQSISELKRIEIRYRSVEEIEELQKQSKQKKSYNKIVLVRGLKNYRFDGDEGFLSLKGKRNLIKIRLEKLPLHHALTKEKKKKKTSF